MWVCVQVPTVTRWNSFYEAVSKIVKDDIKINKVCQALQLPVIPPAELQFLKDYCAVVKPVSTAIDILQGDKNCYLGCVLPTIKSLITNVENTPTSVAMPLKTAILEGLHTRFDQYYMLSDFILAAVCHPKFKLYWVDNPADKARYTQMLETACTSVPVTLETTDGESESDQSPSTDEDHDKFFVLHDSSVSTSSQCHAYLSDTDRSLEMLSRYPKVKSIFIKFNTVLPSSAPVERLFSAASIILSKRRNRLSDDTFEKLLMLRQNRHLTN